MTLKCYYEKIPQRNAPRSEFIQRVALRCGVSAQTVRNWCLYGIKPQSYQHVKVLCEMTGLTEEELWEQ